MKEKNEGSEEGKRKQGRTEGMTSVLSLQDEASEMRQRSRAGGEMVGEKGEWSKKEKKWSGFEWSSATTSFDDGESGSCPISTVSR